MDMKDVPSHSLEGELNEERFEGHDLRALLSVLTAATQITAAGDAVLRRAGAGMRLAEFDILALVYVAGSIRPSEIQKRVSMSASAPTIHAIISRLEKRGLVERSPHPDDARGVLVNITDEGREAIHRTFPLIERKVINLFAAHFSAEELLTIAGLLERH
jgi:DNA-binding MarR family transcriptional regulator